MLTTINILDERNNLVKIVFKNHDSLEGQLYSHKYSYYLQRAIYEEKGYKLGLGICEDNYKDLRKRLKNGL